MSQPDRRRTAWSRYSTTVAFLILAFATAFGFWRVEQLAAEVERESIVRAQSLCEENNRVRMLMATTLRSLFEDSDQTFNETLANIDDRLTALEQTVLAPKDCAQVAQSRRNG